MILRPPCGDPITTTPAPSGARLIHPPPLMHGDAARLTSCRSRLVFRTACHSRKMEKGPAGSCWEDQTLLSWPTPVNVTVSHRFHPSEPLLLLTGETLRFCLPAGAPPSVRLYPADQDPVAMMMKM
ncbi:hypothetical protein LIA77_06070 [Sarocladium implicatum]|nr:hypothetical protein LIA77_06070 [Sarocladium implicatum]